MSYNINFNIIANLVRAVHSARNSSLGSGHRAEMSYTWSKLCCSFGSYHRGSADVADRPLLGLGLWFQLVAALTVYS